MEFEFRKDFISEQATVKISMGHEAFADLAGAGRAGRRLDRGTIG